MAFLLRLKGRSLLNQSAPFNVKAESVDKETREGFKKKHSCGFLIFSKLCYTPIFLIHLHIFPFSEITQVWQYLKIVFIPSDEFTY